MNNAATTVECPARKRTKTVPDAWFLPNNLGERTILISPGKFHGMTDAEIVAACRADESSGQ